MSCIVTIGGADQVGALARITTYFARKGYVVKGHRLADTSSGAKLLKISLDATKVDGGALSAEIKDLNPNYTVVSVENGAFESAQPRSVLVKEMASQFPEIAPLVQTYGKLFGANTREKELFDVGKKIGAYIYSKDWAFGTPLSMPAALRRALVPALEGFGELEATDEKISLVNSPFCGAENKINCCEFLTGFAQGFLDASPATQSARVEKVTCRGKGDLHCTYIFK